MVTVSTTEKLVAEDFDKKVLESSVPVLVKFYKPLCHGCQQLAPVIDELAEKYRREDYRIRIYACSDSELMRRCRVYFVPQLILFSYGKEHWLDRSIKTADSLYEAIRVILEKTAE